MGCYAPNNCICRNRLFLNRSTLVSCAPTNRSNRLRMIAICVFARCFGMRRGMWANIVFFHRIMATIKSPPHRSAHGISVESSSLMSPSNPPDYIAVISDLFCICALTVTIKIHKLRAWCTSQPVIEDVWVVPWFESSSDANTKSRRTTITPYEHEMRVRASILSII